MTGGLAILVIATLGYGHGRPEGRPLRYSSDHPPRRASDQPLHEFTTRVGAVQAAGVIADIRVHGNQVSTDEEVVRLAGVTVGAPFESSTVDAIRERLRASHRFDDVQVLKRYASIVDPSKITIVIVVNEGPVSVEAPAVPGAPSRITRRRAATDLMYMPILNAEDGYGVTFGVRVAYAGVGSTRGRVSFPLTWGGMRRAGAEVERTFRRGPLTRVEAGAAIQQQENPAFEEPDQRRRIWARAERALGPLRGGATIGWQRIRFAGLDDRARTTGADVRIDTRLDPVLPRNAIFAEATWTRWHFSAGDVIDRTRVEARGYLGLVGQTVVVMRVIRESASAPQPAYLQSLLGGWSNLRGFRAGALTGDTLVAGSIELRIPLSSALSVGKVGVSAFVDAGEAYVHGARFDSDALNIGAGGGVWLAVTAFRLGLSVAHGRGASTRVNFGAGLTF